jgi:hypothetical protein
MIQKTLPVKVAGLPRRECRSLTAQLIRAEPAEGTRRPAPPYPKSPNFHYKTVRMNAVAVPKPALKDTKPKGFSP